MLGRNGIEQRKTRTDCWVDEGVQVIADTGRRAEAVGESPFVLYVQSEAGLLAGIGHAVPWNGIETIIGSIGESIIRPKIQTVLSFYIIGVGQESQAPFAELVDLLKEIV